MDNNKDNNEELNKMFEEEKEYEKTYDNEKVQEKEKPKVYVKKDDNLNNKGFAHYKQLIVPFVILVVMVIIIEIYNFISL